jgi:hypothetical protein
MNSSQFSNEDSDIKLFKVFNKLKNAQHSKELKKVKQEKESLIVQFVWITCFDWLFEIWEYHAIWHYWFTWE